MATKRTTGGLLLRGFDTALKAKKGHQTRKRQIRLCFPNSEKLKLSSFL